MSFYSALVLAANDAVREPSSEEVQSLLRELGLLNESGRLAKDVIELFSDADARKTNNQFFCPDDISFYTEIEIPTEDDVFIDTGMCLRFHGYGYRWPWTADDLRKRVTQTPKLIRLRQMVKQRFSGRFVFRDGHEAALRERWIDGDEGWMWFISESF
jgi:hypothetical protein